VKPGTNLDLIYYLVSTHTVQAQALIFLSFEGQKKQKPIFSHKAAGANQPHTKSKTRAAFY